MQLIVAHAALSADCRLILVDGKRVELGLWRDCADRFIGPSIDDAIDTLHWLQGQIDERTGWRGLIHFHAIFRLDGFDPTHPQRTVPPHPALTADVLAEAIRQAARVTWSATVPHPAKPRGWDITWGAQVDPRVVRLTGDGQITDVAVASYLAKYATKSTEPVGALPPRITAHNAPVYANPATHQGRLIAACLRLGGHPHEDFKALRRWAHMLGYRGHFATKSRRYSTTMRALRTARRDWKRRQHPIAERHGERTVITLTDLEWAGRGWRTTGDALLALSAAARAREHRRIARDEASIA